MEISKTKLMEIFFNEVCGKPYILIDNQPLYLSVYYRVRENNEIKRQVVPNEKENDNEKPVINIIDIHTFQDKLYEYVQKYLSSNLVWTNYWMANTKMDDIKLALINLWTNATWQDYENPIALIERYSSFLEKDKLYETLAKGKEILHRDGTTVKMKVEQNDWELETPYKFIIEAEDNEGRKVCPGVHYGIHNKEAYIYAVQGIKYINGYGTNNYENETIREIRQVTRQEGKKDDYRGSEPLAITSLMCFFEALKQNGIQKVNVASFLPLRYNSKTKLDGSEVGDEVQNMATNRFLLQIRHIMHYHSDGIKLLSVPGETGDFLSIDIKDYKPRGEIIKEACNNIDKVFLQLGQEER